MNELSITIVQYDQIWEDVTANIGIIDTMLSALHMTTNIIILPEMFTTGFTQNINMATTMEGKEVLWMKQKAALYQALIMGSLIVEDGGRYYNRLLAVYPDGSMTHYDKRHLFSLMHEDQDFTAGKFHTIITYKDWRIAPYICYDLRFPVWCRNTENADLMVFVANWPQKRHYHWTTLLKARAMENQCYVAGVNRIGMDNLYNEYNGQSAVYDFWGNSLILAENLQTLHTVTISKDRLMRHRADFPFWKDADNFNIYE